MYKAVDVAKYIIWYCKQQGYSISNLKLQKILYFVQAAFLVDHNRQCFAEQIEAWDFGPVVPEVYHHFKIFGSSDIPAFEGLNKKTIIKRSERKIINEMVDQCAEYSASSLVEITHHQDPWCKAYKKGRNNIISNESIRKYFNED